MPELDLVSVVVATHNGAGVIGAQLDGLAQQTDPGPWELVVVDDGSTDATSSIIEEWIPRISRLRLKRADSTLGAAHARNVGASLAEGSLLLFCDDDDVVDTGWVAAMRRGLQNYDAVGGHCERRLLNDEVALATRPEKPVGKLQEGFGFLAYPLSANCGVRKSVWEAVGGFNPAYDNSEDVDFFWRVQLAGYRLGVIPDAIVHYRLRRDIPSMMRQYYRYGLSHPKLFRDYAAAGMPRRGVPSAGSEWRWLLAHLPALGWSRRSRALWLTRGAMRWGRVVGSLRHRSWYP